MRMKLAFIMNRNNWHVWYLLSYCKMKICSWGICGSLVTLFGVVNCNIPRSFFSNKFLSNKITISKRKQFRQFFNLCLVTLALWISKYYAINNSATNMCQQTLYISKHKQKVTCRCLVSCISGDEAGWFIHVTFFFLFYVLHFRTYSSESS